MKISEIEILVNINLEGVYVQNIEGPLFFGVAIPLQKIIFDIPDLKYLILNLMVRKIKLLL